MIMVEKNNSQAAPALHTHTAAGIRKSMQRPS